MYHQLTALVTGPYEYFKKVFYGIMIDTECAHASSDGIEQYRAYCPQVGEEKKIDKSAVAKCKFVVGSTTSMGTNCIKFSISHTVLSITMHFIEVGVPLLLSLADTYSLRI